MYDDTLFFLGINLFKVLIWNTGQQCTRMMGQSRTLTVFYHRLHALIPGQPNICELRTDDRLTYIKTWLQLAFSAQVCLSPHILSD